MKLKLLYNIIVIRVILFLAIKLINYLKEGKCIMNNFKKITAIACLVAVAGAFAILAFQAKKHKNKPIHCDKHTIVWAYFFILLSIIINPDYEQTIKEFHHVKLFIENLQFPLQFFVPALLFPYFLVSVFLSLFRLPLLQLHMEFLVYLHI